MSIRNFTIAMSAKYQLSEEAALPLDAQEEEEYL